MRCSSGQHFGGQTVNRFQFEMVVFALLAYGIWWKTVSLLDAM